MHYRHLKKLCRGTNKLTRSEKYDILGNLFLFPDTEILLSLCELDITLYMSNGKNGWEHEFHICGNRNNPLIYIDAYIPDGCFWIHVGFGLTELCETIIKNGIHVDFRNISYGELMWQYRCCLYNDLKNDKNIRYVSDSKFHLGRSPVRFDITDTYTTEAILEYNKLKYLRYGNNFNKKVCCSSKRKKSLGVYV